MTVVLFRLEIEHCGALFHGSLAGGDSGNEEECFCQRGLATTSVPYQGDVSYVLGFHNTSSSGLSIIVSEVCAGSVGYIDLSVIDLRVRPRLQWLLQPIGRALANRGVTPQIMTLFGLLITILGGVLIGFGRLGWGAGVALFGSALDGLDGSVARAAGTESSRGALLDAAADRVGEVAVFAGLAAAVAPERRVVTLIVLAVGGSMLVPYMRAKVEAEGLDGRGGMMGRAERVLLFSAGLFTGLIEPMLWVLVVAVWATVAWRFFLTYRELKT